MALKRSAGFTGSSLRRLAQWIDNDVTHRTLTRAPERHIDWWRVIPFIAVHVACVGVLWTGTSAVAVEIAVGLYVVRMFAITAFYHRCFAHRSFRTSRATQFAFACLAASSGQRGPLWWVSHHRHHHAHSDGATDAHSPRQHGFLWSHIGWFLARENFAARPGLVPDLARYPELRFIDRFDVLPPLVLGLLLYGTGALLDRLAPGLNTSGPQLVIWGFCISTVALYHATFTINSFAHRFGQRRYATADDSRNNPWLAVLTLGEGWHNNHHHYPGAARQGFFWWEVDLSYYVLRVLAATGLVWNLKQVPAPLLAARRT